MFSVVPSGFCLLLAATLYSVIPLCAADTYNVVKSYEGPSFFDDWVFYDHFDNLTNGDVVFVSASEAKSSQLAFVDSNTNHAIIKVDNTSTVTFNNKRNTVRITSSAGYGVGSVWIADLLHIPFGCSVWPAWWSQAPTWPTGGEIDTLEGVNLVTRNQIGLHTNPGCTVVNPKQSSTLQNSTDCSNLSNNNQGCVVTDPNTQAYGAAFAQAGGGVYVTEYAESGISIWFFSRANVPSSLSSNASTIDTSTFGLPVANYPSTGCSMDTFFSAQNLIFDITLCGDFAGNPGIFSQTCSGVCYNDYVLGNGSNYANAYFEVASVRVFGKPGTNTTVNTTTTGSGSGSGGGSGGGNSASLSVPHLSAAFSVAAAIVAVAFLA